MQTSKKQTSTQGSRDLTVGNIWKHITYIAFPAMFGQLFSTLYNLTDTFWGGKISTDALAAFSLTFPIFIITMAAGQCLASGGIVLISNYLGEKKEKKALYYLEQTGIASLLSGILLMILIWIFSSDLLHFLGARNDVLTYGKSYINVFAFSIPFMVLFFSLNGGLTSRGNTRFMRNILIMNTVINLILDPLCMYGVTFGNVVIVPAMGISGVALATVIVQILGAVLICIKTAKLGYIRIDAFRHYIINIKAVGRVLWYGLPSAVQIMLVSFGLGLVNYFLSRLSGSQAVAAYGVGLRIEQIALIPSFGINIALSSLVGQNNGAGNIPRILESYKKAMLAKLLLMLCVMLPITLLGTHITSLFATDPVVVQITQRYLYFAFLAFYAYQLLTAAGSVLQGMKHPKIPIIVHTLRHFLFPWFFIPVLVFVFHWGIYGIFTSVVASVWLAALLMNVFAFATIRKRNLSTPIEKPDR